jgi:PKD repeat protein
VFADNFDTGSPVQVLNEPNYNYVMIGAPWNDPPAGWSEIPLTAPFLYNASDNMVIQCEYSGINYPIPLYANNGGIPIAQICSVFDSTIADSYTARPMIGISGAQSPVNFAASDSSVCEKFCIDFFDFSSNSPFSWLWEFPGGVPSTSTDQNPDQICYDNPGVFDVTLITSNSTGADTLVLPGFITVYATPIVPTITVSGNTLTSSPADSYQWQYNFTDIPGATGQSYVATQSGAFTIVITDVSGCTALNTIDFTLTGAIDLVSEKNIYLFPNPANDKIYIGGLDDFHSGDLSIQITTTLGDVVLPAHKISATLSHSIVINLLEFPAGIYFLKFSGSINSQPVSVVKKLVIE